MDIKEHESLKGKTTMRIGGTARYFADLQSKEDVEEAIGFANEKDIPLIMLGSGSNTIFADSEINALVIRIKADEVTIKGNEVEVQSGKTLAMLINELVDRNLDLSPLTGIPGTVGGAIFGNAGQGAKGIWIDSFIKAVTVFMDGEWQTLSRDDCKFRYRESLFKDDSQSHDSQFPIIIWSATLTLPSRPADEITSEIEALLQRRIETQPHLKTAGSCFKSLPDGTPAWKLIDQVGLRGKIFGDIEISEKHANFLLNKGNATFEDVQDAISAVQREVPAIEGVEMRLIGEDGEVVES